VAAVPGDVSPTPLIKKQTKENYLSIYSYTVDLLHSLYDSLEGNQPVARQLPTHRTAQTQNKSTQTSMHQVGFEPTIPAFERGKRVHALDRAATVIGNKRKQECLKNFAEWN
jgi:hypothetical protein